MNRKPICEITISHGALHCTRDTIKNPCKPHVITAYEIMNFHYHSSDRYPIILMVFFVFLKNWSIIWQQQRTNGININFSEVSIKRKPLLALIFKRNVKQRDKMSFCDPFYSFQKVFNLV